MLEIYFNTKFFNEQTHKIYFGGLVACVFKIYLISSY